MRTHPSIIPGTLWRHKKNAQAWILFLLYEESEGTDPAGSVRIKVWWLHDGHILTEVWERDMIERVFLEAWTQV